MIAIGKALYTKLTGGTALTALLANGSSVYYQQAHDSATLPYVVYSHTAGGPENICDHDMRSEIWTVRAFATSPLTAGSIDTQISALLHKGTITVSGYANFWLARETDISLVENTPEGVKIWSEGADYRVRLG